MQHTFLTLGNVINYVPVVATVVTCIFSLVLARATLRYVEATDKGLELAREGFEREWSPELHIKLQRTAATEVNVIVTNLGKASVLLQMMQIRRISHAVPLERYVLNNPLVGGMSWTESIGQRILSTTGTTFEGVIAASITFYSAGRMYRTDWFRFNATVRNGKIYRLESVNLPTQRVRVVHHDNVPVHRELVQDVTRDLMPETQAAD